MVKNRTSKGKEGGLSSFQESSETVQGTLLLGNIQKEKARVQVFEIFEILNVNTLVVLD